VPLSYRADIDGLRALAVLSVLGYHFFPEWVPGGFIGVDVFFVISGYLITRILSDEFHQKGIHIGHFYARRIRRIFPALVLVLLFCFFAGWYLLLANEYKQLGKHIFGGASFTSNFFLWQETGYFDNASDTKPLLHPGRWELRSSFISSGRCYCGCY
jgi:peptidoglycan/LPS O-acetylase OafA/YrhL